MDGGQVTGRARTGGDISEERVGGRGNVLPEEGEPQKHLLIFQCYAAEWEEESTTVMQLPTHSSADWWDLFTSPGIDTR